MPELSAIALDLPATELPPAPALDLPAKPCKPGISFVVAIGVECAIFIVLLGLLMAGGNRVTARHLQILLSIMALLTIAWNAAHRHRLWGRPMRVLCEMLPLVRSGKLPIEELSRVEGKLAPLARECQQILQDLRSQRSAAAAMEIELRQRVANRTDALERTIGSLRQQASRDALTGLYNRRMLDEHLPRAVNRCRQEAVELCLLMIDVNYFKQLNDTRGHAAGDEFLRGCGQIIRSSIRDRDVAFRFGGDEFVVLLENQPLEAAIALRERLVSLVDGLAKSFHVTPAPGLSIGVAALSELAEPTPRHLLQRADELLYEIKSARRRS